MMWKIFQVSQTNVLLSSLTSGQFEMIIMKSKALSLFNFHVHWKCFVYTVKHNLKARQFVLLCVTIRKISDNVWHYWLFPHHCTQVHTHVHVHHWLLHVVLVLTPSRPGTHWGWPILRSWFPPSEVLNRPTWTQGTRWTVPAVGETEFTQSHTPPHTWQLYRWRPTTGSECARAHV